MQGAGRRQAGTQEHGNFAVVIISLIAVDLKWFFFFPFSFGGKKTTFIGDKTGGCFDDCILQGSWLWAEGEGEKKLPKGRLVMRLAKQYTHTLVQSFSTDDT